MRKPWLPSRWSGDYKLAPSIYQRVFVLLDGLKNRDAAFRLFVFLARFNASPKRIGAPFPVDRRALCGRDDLRLTENEIRGAIAALRKNGLIEVVETTGKAHRVDERGIRRLPLRFRFASVFLGIFRYILARYPLSPKDRQESILFKDSTRGALLMGELRRDPRQLTLRPLPQPLAADRRKGGAWTFDNENPLHAALRRLGGQIKGVSFGSA